MGWVLRVAGRVLRRLSLGALLSAELGNVAMIFALALMPMMAVTGGAVDLSRALWVRARLSQALDAAGLAVGATVGLDDAAMQELAQEYFDANYPEQLLGTPGNLHVSLTEQVIHLSATAELDTTLMALLGIYTLDVAAESEITRETKGLEAVLVLDTTGSMASSGKIEALRQAATDLVDILAGENDFPEHLKIGIVPFAISVKVNPAQAVDDGWIDTIGASSTAQLNFSGGKYAYWLYSNPSGMTDTPWTGCLEARPAQRDETDAVPDSSVPDTRWVPMFQPDEPDISDPANPLTGPAGELARANDVVNTNQAGLNSSFPNNYIVVPNVSVYEFAVSAVSSASDSLTASGHSLSTGNGPFAVTSTDTLPGGTSDSAGYWIIRVDSSTVKLATSAANAAAGTAVNITSAGSGSIAISGASPANDTLWIRQRSSTVGKDVPTATVSSGHGMSTGNGPINLYVASAAGDVPTGLNATTSYWVIRVDSNTIKLATSRSDALAGTAIDFSTTGSGSRAISEAPAGTDLAHQADRQTNWEKYVGRTFSGTSGPYAGCGMQAVTPLTNNKAVLLSRISVLNPAGYTNIPLGLSWGWRVLSPLEPYTEGVEYDNEDTVKAIVLMTDGDNCVGSNNCVSGGSADDTPINTLNRTHYTPFGYGSQTRLGAGIDTESEIEDEMDASLARTCDNIKAVHDASGNERIRIYTIALMVSDTATINRLRDCATTPELFFNTPSAAELQQVFHTIAQDLSNLRISH